MFGTIYICPTPIGNLDDITIRTLNTLKHVDLIAAEDTRHTIKLLNHFDISKPLTSYHDHNKETKGSFIIDKLLNGENVALVSDAGMPGISDPGEMIIKEAIDANIKVEVLPGASASITALVGSGLNTDKFVFEGFLNREKKTRKKELEKLKYEMRTIIFYESPHRLLNTLSDMMEILGDRNMCACRELTKKYEERIRGNISDVIQIFKQKGVKGEFVLIVDGSLEEEVKGENFDHLTIKERLIDLIDKGMDKKDAIKYVAKERSLSKNDVYKESLDL